jgi:hypothetical protein
LFHLMANQVSDKVCQWLATGQWFSVDTLVSSSNKIYRHDITGILLKVALNTISLIQVLYLGFFIYRFLLFILCWS